MFTLYTIASEIMNRRKVRRRRPRFDEWGLGKYTTSFLLRRRRLFFGFLSSSLDSCVRSISQFQRNGTQFVVFYSLIRYISLSDFYRIHTHTHTHSRRIDLPHISSKVTYCVGLDSSVCVCCRSVCYLKSAMPLDL